MVKKCKTCGKQLLDEKIPICLRCRLKGRNNTVEWGGKLVGVLGSVAVVANLVDGNKNTPSKKL